MTDEPLKEAARKELDRMAVALGGVSLKERTPETEKVFLLAKSYHSDGEHFFSQGRWLEAFEAAVICWAYLDAGLHLGAFGMTEGLAKKGIFTI